MRRIPQVLAGLAHCLLAARALAGEPSRLIWADEFDAGLDLTTNSHVGAWRANAAWQDATRGYQDFAGASWNVNPNETGFAAFSPFTVASGVLTITARRTPRALTPAIERSKRLQGQSGPAPAWMGGFLTTNPAVRTFRYGYFEIRARWPNAGKGMFPAIWLYAAKPADNPAKAHGEIDLVEIFGNPSGDRWRGALHLSDAAGRARVIDVTPDNADERDDLRQWRVFGFEWRADALRFFVDGKLRHEIIGADTRWYDFPMALILNYAMDGPWFGPGRSSDASTPDGLRMEVDYVRVYTSKPAGD